MNENNKNDTNFPFNKVDKEKEVQKGEFWQKVFMVSLIFSIIMFIVMVNQEDASVNAFIFGGLLLVGIILTILSVVKINKCIAKSQNLSADEYLKDRFENAIPETIETFNLDKKDNNSTSGVTCPYCKSTNVSKISVVNRIISVELMGLSSGKIGKQWHCNGCKSDF